jgi:tubulin--tyrosine ligase-like protein 12
MGEFFKRDKLGLDNHWIIKPIGMSRSMDTYLVNDLDAIIRLMETGPKIC